MRDELLGWQPKLRSEPRPRAQRNGRQLGFFYEPSERTLARQTTGAVARSTQSGAGRALRYAGAPRSPAALPNRK